MRRLASVFAFVLMAGCATTEAAQTEAAPPAAPAETTYAASGEPLDPFVLMIDAGRTHIFVDRIETAIGLSLGAPGIAEAEGQEADLRRAADSIRRARIDFMKQKIRACAEGHFTEISCTPTALPAWLSEPADVNVSPAEVQRRIDELQTEMGPLVDAACEYGKVKSEDPMFCSVE